MRETPSPERDPAAGLCAGCLHARRITSARGSTFCLCERSAVDAAFARYPVLPVLHCQGYEPRVRIVSLLASGTEIVCALGAGDGLVGRSHECDVPAWVRELPSCTSPAYDVSGSSRDIDAEVRRRLHAREPLYTVDSALIHALRPRIVISQTQCDVCAVTPGDVARAGTVEAEQIVALASGSVDGIYDGIRRVARALERAEAGEALVASLQARMNAVTDKVRDRPAPTVVVLEWTAPLFASGNWMPELVVAAGGRPLLCERGQYSAAVRWEDVVAADPDHLVVAPCGFDLDRTLQEVPILEGLPGWQQLRAVRLGRVAFADGNRYFNRSGPSIADTVEMLAEILHDIGRAPRENAWRRYQAVVPTA